MYDLFDKSLKSTLRRIFPADPKTKGKYYWNKWKRVLVIQRNFVDTFQFSSVDNYSLVKNKTMEQFVSTMEQIVS